jgi:hypothetical protein
MNIELVRQRMYKARLLSVMCSNCDELENKSCAFGLALLAQSEKQCNNCPGCLKAVCSMGEVIKADHLEDQLHYCYTKRGNGQRLDN